MLIASPSDRYARAALTRECDELAHTASGRNARLNAAAFALGQLVGAGLLNEGEVVRALVDAAEACGYIAKDGRPAALATIRSGLRRGLVEPRDIPSHGGGRRSEVDPREQLLQAKLRDQQRRAWEAEAHLKEARARRLFAEADPQPAETLAGRYYAEHRGLDRDLLEDVSGHAIRFAALGPWGDERVPMVLDAFRDWNTNAVVGLRRTRLNPVTAQKEGRRMLGRASGAAIKLSCDSDVGAGLCVAEGTETAIAGMMAGLRPMWALGSAGAIRTLPLLRGISALTICAEFDDGGANAAAIEEVGNRWCDAGREVFVAAPRIGSDLNDAIRKAAR